jgi:hypothetical protein
MRKYIKRSCDRWGHVAHYTETAIDQETKNVVGYYGKCSRCSKRIFIETNGEFDSGTFTHLLDITLQDLPKLTVEAWAGQYF